MADPPQAAREPGVAGRVFVELEREYDRERLAAVLTVLEEAAGRHRAAGPGRDN